MEIEVKAIYYLVLFHKIKSFRRTRDKGLIEIETITGARKIFDMPDLIGILFRYASKEFSSLEPYNSPIRYKKLRERYENS